MKKDKYTFALIGCGGIGFTYDYGRQTEGAYTHFRAFDQSPYFDIIAVADTISTTRELIARERGIPTYGDYCQMLEEHKPEVVSIAAPDHLHTSMLMECLAHKPRVVFCEKPLGSSQSEAEAIVEAYTRAGVGLLVNFTRRFVPEFRTIAEVITSGDIGAVQHVSIYYSRGLVHNASHYLDVVLYLFGEPASVELLRVRPGLTPGDPTATAVLHYEKFDIVIAGMESGSLLTNEIDIVGTLGRVQITTDDVYVRSAVRVHPVYQQYTMFEEIERKQLSRSAALPAAAANLYGFLQGTEELLSPGVNSIRIFQIIDSIQEQPSWRNWHYSAGQGR